MDMSTPPNAPPQGIALVEQWLALARSGQWPLPQVMEAASRLQQAGAADAAVLLYENWVAATASPLSYVACFNWGAILGEQRRHAEAEAVYRRALAQSPPSPSSAVEAPQPAGSDSTRRENQSDGTGFSTPSAPV